ncbi:MAG: hypothetical protein SNG69_02230 [Rikenellaceae bacterium]
MNKKRKYTEGIESIKAYEITGFVTDEERVFCFLHALCGMPASKAFYHAFARSRRSTLASCASPACHLLKEPHIVSYIRTLWAFYDGGQLEFNESAIKG